MTDPQERLAEEFGGPLPPGLAALAPEHQQVLADDIHDARERQAAALARATDRGLDFIPKLLRGPVKKVLFG